MGPHPWPNGDRAYYLAAPFEGFFSFDPRIPSPVKLTVGIVIAVGYYLFYRGVGRQYDEPHLTAG